MISWQIWNRHSTKVGLLKEKDDAMPITIPDNLPAAEFLENENIFVMNGQRASHQDIRPLQILILNLMQLGAALFMMQTIVIFST